MPVFASGTAALPSHRSKGAVIGSGEEGSGSVRRAASTTMKQMLNILQVAGSYGSGGSGLGDSRIRHPASSQRFVSRRRCRRHDHRRGCPMRVRTQGVYVGAFDIEDAEESVCSSAGESPALVVLPCHTCFHRSRLCFMFYRTVALASTILTRHFEVGAPDDIRRAAAALAVTRLRTRHRHHCRARPYRRESPNLRTPSLSIPSTSPTVISVRPRGWPSSAFYP